MKIAVGSENPAKLEAAKIVVKKLFSKAKVLAVKVNSGVDAQPKSDKETILGAINRAKIALKRAKADFGIGMEGGIHKIGKSWFECGWIAVVDKNGKIGLGSSGRWQVSRRIVKDLHRGYELAEVFESLTNRKGIHLEEGVMGVITNGHLPRHHAYSHGVFFAFAPFISDKKFWD